MKPYPYRPTPKRNAPRARPGLAGRSQTRSALFIRTTAARNTAAAGDRLPPSSPLLHVGRRTFLGFAALLGGAGAYGAHKRFTGNQAASDRHVEPFSGALTLEHATPTLVQTHGENSSPRVAPGKLSLTVEYGAEETIGGVSFREIRGVSPIT